MAKNLTGVPAPVSDALGFGLGDQLKNQEQETEEQRRKRLLGLQNDATRPPVSPLFDGTGMSGAVTRGLLGR